MNKSYIKNMVLTAFGAVMIAFCAWITVPFVVPFTLQTVGVFSVLQILGGKRGACSILIYTLLGMLGIPVFSGFSGGLSVLLGPTGGYIIGFFVSGVLYWIFERFASRSIYTKIVLILCCQLVCYALGTVGYMLWANNTDGNTVFLSALSLCVLPYILPDMLKLFVSAYLSKRVKKAVRV